MRSDHSGSATILRPTSSWSSRREVRKGLSSLVQWSRMPIWTLSGLWVWSALCLAGRLASRGRVVSAYSEAMVEVVFFGSVWGREFWGNPLFMQLSSNPCF